MCWIVNPRGWRIDRERCEAPGFLLLWLILPPTALYVYSLVSYSLFGPAPYTLFVAPAYLVLVASGLSRLPAVARYPLAIGLAITSSMAMGPMVYAPDLKADWRDFSKEVAESAATRPGMRILVIVASADPSRNVEVETARYYLPVSCTAIASEEATSERLARLAAGEVYFAVGSRQGEPVASVPESVGPYQLREARRYPGLIVYRGFSSSTGATGRTRPVPVRAAAGHTGRVRPVAPQSSLTVFQRAVSVKWWW